MAFFLPRAVEEKRYGRGWGGWIAAIIIGGIAGWLAEMFMKSNMGGVDEHCAARCGGHRSTRFPAREEL